MTTENISTKPSHWPVDVSIITLDELDRIGVDKEGRLYWDGKSVSVGQHVALTFLQKLGSFLIVIGTIVGAFAGMWQANTAYLERHDRISATTRVTKPVDQSVSTPPPNQDPLAAKSQKKASKRK